MKHIFDRRISNLRWIQLRVRALYPDMAVPSKRLSDKQLTQVLAHSYHAEVWAANQVISWRACGVDGDHVVHRRLGEQIANRAVSRRWLRIIKSYNSKH